MNWLLNCFDSEGENGSIFNSSFLYIRGSNSKVALYE